MKICPFFAIDKHYLSYFESIDSKKTCIFQVRTYKVPIEEMTDRWETGISDG